MRVAKFDLAIVGGGLAGGLAALALARTRPELKIALIERGDRFGGNHLWSYFGSDIAPGHRWLVAPLICHGWAGNRIRFPEYERELDQQYFTIESEQLDEMLRRTLPSSALYRGQKALACGPTSVVLENGLRIETPAVIDARGTGEMGALDCGWQLFVGEEWELAEPHTLTRPIIMDATVDQAEGYRFVYVLPFTPTRIFVEDTYYRDSPKLDEERLSARIAAYCDGEGWRRARLLRRETGVLPVPRDGDIEKYWAAGGAKVPKIGVRGGFFHPTTSYSLPDAVRIAMLIAQSRDITAEYLNIMLRDEAFAHWQSGGFCRMLNRMLFDAAAPEDRYKVMQRFYRLPQRLIERFYAGQLNLADKSRILAGRPPVPVLKALKAAAFGRDFGAGAS